MNSNELQEHIRELNKRELLEHERRRVEAINKIKELRKQLKEKENGVNFCK
ncbi:hypothetical protein UFOVP322_30 [uncultured Caudovirales phage]|uniref:Uncharacterized protein n=1 Tax=uncultured Caudovirales phage TaxID=2100421 RepID=A0A6J5NNK2_9CAUD|nr:hypothetical protein UFOVP322_30 [uncultured Caudovirales phage]CAB4160979.1 hypothetical protein UFOVP771_28 [uncultured Caudovirales phage]CAB4166397.1 hypothetical protein UFOVP850_28 [uncultured Caudovirales phage]